MAVRRFGATWWGRAWVDALEHRAGIDPNRLPRGRTYARQDRVARLEVERGRVTALVRGSRALPYRVTITVRTADDAGWDAVAAAVAARSGHAAALLDGELEPSLVEDASEAGVELLPGPGDLSMRCSCPDWADPCKHAAAVAYLVADELDADPFALLRLRGVERGWLLDRVRAHRAATADAPTPASTIPGGRLVAAAFGGGPVVDPGVVARDGWARTPGPVPPRRDLPAAPGEPGGWVAEAPKGAPFTVAGLTELAADAARRALAQLADGAPSQLDLDEEADLARRAAGRIDHRDELLALARRAGASSGELAHQGLAWRSAGRDGIAVVDEALWRPSPSVVQQGLDAFAEAGVDPEEVQIRSNRLTVDDVQLRVSQDLRWWRFERRGRAWELVEPPAADPLDLIDT